jgi:hypothetical protein
LGRQGLVRETETGDESRVTTTTWYTYTENIERTGLPSMCICTNSTEVKLVKEKDFDISAPGSNERCQTMHAQEITKEVTESQKALEKHPAKRMLEWKDDEYQENKDSECQTTRSTNAEHENIAISSTEPMHMDEKVAKRISSNNIIFL